MEQQTEPKTKSKKKYACACCAVGCGLPSLVVLVLVFLFLYDEIYYGNFGENRKSSPILNAKKGTDYCYYTANRILFPRHYLEFTISEPDFLDWGKSLLNTHGRSWEPLEISDLPSLPKPNMDWEDDETWPMVNPRQGDTIPLSIPRYICGKEEHKECSPWNGRCLISFAGKADNSCIRLVDDGYYIEERWRNGGSNYILYERENQRCYYAYCSN